jgi:hypothetical protein
LVLVVSFLWYSCGILSVRRVLAQDKCLRSTVVYTTTNAVPIGNI